MNRQYSLALTVLLLATIGWFYFVSDGSPIDYLRSFFRENPPTVQEMSPEQFRSMVKRTEHRHGRHEPTENVPETKNEPTPPDTMVVDPDTSVRNQWKQRFTPSTRDQLRSMEVIPATPGIERRRLAAKDLTGDTQSSRDYRGRWVLLNFWASWCLPCREEMPSLDRLNDRFPDRLTVVAINVGENREDVREFKDDVDFDFPVWMDPDRTLTEQFGTRRLPETWILDPDGKFVGVLQGPRDWTTDRSMDLFRSLTSS